MSRARIAALVGGLAVVVLAVALSAGLGGIRDEALWIEARPEPFVRRIAASGELRSSNSVIVGCPSVDYMWDFTITMIADEGKQLSKGQPVLAFDERKLQERLEVKSSELDTARKELEKDRLNLQDQHDARILAVAEARAEKARLERELDVPLDLRASLELEKLRIDARLAARRLELATQAVRLHERNRDLRLAAAERKVLELEREVGRIREGLARLRVSAPRAGYVVHVADWRGDKPKVGESVWRGRPLLELADLSRMLVAAEVAEADAGFVRESQEVEIRLDAAPDRLFRGRIRRLGRLFRTKSQDVPSKVFDAVVEIDEPDAELMRPGMAASVEILAPTDVPVIQVPDGAIDMRDGGAFVEVLRDGDQTTVPVELGIRWKGSVVVTSGLEPGDRVRVGDDAV